jgi:hypothetical protein
MWNWVPLVLPVLVPSWRFFKTIEPSPRVQWSLLSEHDDTAVSWHDFRPRAEHVSWLEMVRRLFWNPAWNEALFLVSCAERIQQYPTPHSINEIQKRISRETERMQIDATRRRLQFRLVFVHRGDTVLLEEVVFLSDAIAVDCGRGR